jgi:hypothetical protein
MIVGPAGLPTRLSTYLQVPPDHDRYEPHFGLVPHQLGQPRPVGCRFRRGRILLPSLTQSQLLSNADTHRVDLPSDKITRPAARDCDFSRPSPAAVASLDNSDLDITSGGKQCRQSMRFVQIVIVPEDDVTPASLLDPEVPSQRAPLPSRLRSLQIPGSKPLAEESSLRVDSIGNN